MMGKRHLGKDGERVNCTERYDRLGVTKSRKQGIPEKMSGRKQGILTTSMKGEGKSNF